MDNVVSLDDDELTELVRRIHHLQECREVHEACVRRGQDGLWG